jgi:hypothetical protein
VAAPRDPDDRDAAGQPPRLLRRELDSDLPAIAETGGRPLPLPEPIARPVITRLHDTGLFPFPPGAIDYIKFPCTISGDRFQEATGFRPTFGLREIFRSIRR